MNRNSPGQKAIDKAVAEYKAGDYEAALVTLAGATVDEDDYLDLAYLLGLCYTRMQKYDEALLYLEQLVTSGVEDARIAQCRFSLAYIYSVTGRSKLAELELKKLLEEFGESARTFSVLGYAFWAQGRKQEALEAYKKALTLEPNNKSALNGCGYVMACLDTELPKALRYCEKAMAADPENPAYADSLGWVHYKMGKIESAARFVGKAARKFKGHPEIASHVDAIRKKART